MSPSPKHDQKEISAIVYGEKRSKQVHIAIDFVKLNLEFSTYHAVQWRQWEQRKSWIYFDTWTHLLQQQQQQHECEAYVWMQNHFCFVKFEYCVIDFSILFFNLMKSKSALLSLARSHFRRTNVHVTHVYFECKQYTIQLWSWPLTALNDSLLSHDSNCRQLKKRKKKKKRHIQPNIMNTSNNPTHVADSSAYYGDRK